jgi:hypothetical protein
MGMDSMRAQAAQQGCEMCQHCGMVGSVDPPEASKDSRNDDSLQGPLESPSCKSAPPSPTQQQGHLDATAHSFTLPGLGGINFGMTKEPAFHMESPVSEGTARTMELGRRTQIGGEESEDTKHELLIPLLIKACRAPILLDFKHLILTNTFPAGLFKALANGVTFC